MVMVARKVEKDAAKEKDEAAKAVAEAAVPGFGALFDAAIAIKCFGVATSYLVVVGDSVPQAMVAFGGTGPLLERRVWVLVALAFGAPLAYMERITALR